jgi:hypothetical protein
MGIEPGKHFYHGQANPKCDSPGVIGLLVVTTVVFSLAMDSIKLAVFARVRID